MDLGTHFLENSRREFRGIKALADKAMAQLDETHFFAAPDAESNSWSLRRRGARRRQAASRWTDFLTTDGEKPGRDRTTEFLIGPRDTRAALLERWEAGWAALFAALEPLTPDECLRRVVIRGEPHTVVQAIEGQLTHYGYHVGQIVFLAKQQRGGGLAYAQRTATSRPNSMRACRRNSARSEGRMLSPEMKSCVERQRLGFVASVGRDGAPYSEVAGGVGRCDAGVRGCAVTGHGAELIENPAVEINVVDTLARSGWRFRGRARALVRPHVRARAGVLRRARHAARVRARGLRGR